VNAAPSEVIWEVAGEEVNLFGAPAPAPPAPVALFSVSRTFVTLAKQVICHREPERFALLYAMLMKLRERPDALDDKADPLVHRLEAMARQVRRDIHKMHASVRFCEVETAEGEPAASRFVAWFEPHHHIVRAAAPFFVQRFATMRWSILTPELSLHWDGETLTEGPGASRGDAPEDDPIQEVWKTGYAAIFNPARVEVGAMLKEMPKKYWKNMPEAALVPELLKGAQAREAQMAAASAVKVGDNAGTSWAAVRDEAMHCTRCDLHKHATRTVFGEGPLDARLVFVGEQPGDQEDLAGRPFVGPAGQLFDKALAEAGVPRERTYVTNAVKHFKFARRGRRRIHEKPNGGEIAACRWWLRQELALIRPRLVVALGATAARSLFGKAVTIASMRGKAHELEDGAEAWVTVHPSFLLRVRDDREAEYEKFVADLRRIGERAKALA
jgi:probable DNA metabolism protein